MYKLELYINKNIDSFNTIIKQNILTNIEVHTNNNTYIFTSTETDTTKLKLSDIIADYIIKNFETEIIKNLIHTDYSYFSSSESDAITSKTQELIISENNDITKILISLKRRFLIKQCILNFISENTYLDLSGFINFRLIEYKKLLSELIEKTITDFKIQKEYNEFITMLKFFVDTQKNRAPKLHIIFEKDGEYSILNEYNKNITTECFKDFLSEKQSHSLSNEDLLISSLITLAPKKIIIHLTGPHYNKKILSTIEQIFTNKVVLNESVPTLQLVSKIN